MCGFPSAAYRSSCSPASAEVAARLLTGRCAGHIMNCELGRGWARLCSYASPGGVPERFIGAVLKTVVGQTTVGSNPTPSARF